jgi:hypothetical protein
VKASVVLDGTFEKWDATLVFTSTDVSASLRIKADGRTLLRRGEKSIYNVSFHEDYTDESR